MAAQKKKTGKKAAPPPQKQVRPVRREVGGFVCLLLALCVLVSYFGVQAFFLTLLEKLLKGLTGYGYWLWAAALAVVGVVLVGHGGRPVCLRVTGTLAIPVLSGSLLHLLLCRVAYAPGAIGLPSLRDLWVDGLSLRGGGALSGGLAALLKAGFSSVVAGVLLALVSRSPKHAHKLYLAYRFIPLLFALGFAALLFSDDRTFVVASTCIMLAYLTFEITSLNDFCNAVKAGGLSLVRMFGIARLAITGGMLAGWLLGFGSSLLPPGMPPVPFAVALGAVALVAASTLVFTEKEVFAVRGVADERILQENVARANGEAEGYAANVESFGQRWGMSKREMEVLDLLLKGRNTLYISQQLFIATGTAKTHIYNIYRKTDVHTKMELLDLFDTFCFENARDDPSPR